jgi:hypothetical protein
MTTEFEKLPKEEQNFRWALFLASNGYQKDLTEQRIQEIRQKYLVENKPKPPKML